MDFIGTCKPNFIGLSKYFFYATHMKESQHLIWAAAVKTDIGNK